MKKLLLTILLLFTFGFVKSQNYVICPEDSIRINYAKYVDILYSTNVKTNEDSTRFDIIYVFSNQKRYYSMVKIENKYWCHQYKFIDFSGTEGYKKLLKTLYDNYQHVTGEKNDKYKKDGNILESWLYADEFHQNLKDGSYFRWILYKYDELSIIIVDWIQNQK